MKAMARGFSSIDFFGLLALRIGVGLTMAWHGWQKVDGGISMFGGFLEQLGLPAPSALAYIVTGIELIGGIALIAGALTRVFGLLIAIQMALTGFWIKPTKFQAPFIATEGTGFELDFVLLAGALALAFLGAGTLSVDHATGLDRATNTAPPPPVTT